MKAACLLVLAAFPAGAAQPEPVVDAHRLADAIPVNALLDAKARMADGRPVGDLTELLIDPDGAVKEYLVEVEDAGDVIVGDAVTFSDEVEEPEERSSRDEQPGDAELELEFTIIQPADARYRAHEQVLEIHLPDQPLAVLPQRDRGVSGMHHGLYATDVIGMEVHLADAESFGEIEDVLLDADARHVVAYVIDSWDGLDRERIALPADAARFGVESDTARQEYGELAIEAVTFPYTRAQVDALPEFDLEALADERTD